MEVENELIAQCAESRVLGCTFFGHRAVYKHRFCKTYRNSVLDQKLREQRTVREARALVRCKRFGVSAPTVYFVDRKECVIVMSRIEGIPVRDLLDNVLVGTAIARAVLEAMGEIVGLLHNGDMIHGDLTTSNFMSVASGGKSPSNSISRDDIVILDFGLVQDKQSAEERAVDLYVLERAVKSAHPQIERPEDAILAGYIRTVELNKGKQTVERLIAVRARGRKRSMIG